MLPSSPGQIRAIFFDAVGTLLHPEPPAGVIYAEVGRRFGSRLDLEQIGRRFRGAFQREQEIDRQFGWETNETRERDRWQRIVREVLDDVADPTACFHELYDHFARPAAWRCDQDAETTLSELAARGFALGIASNFDQRLRSVVAGFPALSGIANLHISSEIGWQKPAFKFFSSMCQAVNMPPEQVGYVGDDWDNDYQGARRAGLTAVLFDPAGVHSTVGDVIRIDRLPQVLRALYPRP